MKIYNVKTIQYNNGLVEIRKYSKPIGADSLESIGLEKKDVVERAMRGKKRMDDICKPELTYNPFTEEIEEMLSFEQSAILEQRKERCLKVSFNRTRQEIYNISRQCNWRYFVTLTFDSKKVDRYDFDICMKKANKWFMNQRNRFANDLQYLFVPEQHKDGAWHIHGLIAQCDGMFFVDSGKRWNGKIIYNLGGWKNGFSTAVPIGNTKEDLFKVSTYITKYITKELCFVTKGKRRYYRSQNIPKPIETIELVEGGTDVDYVDIVADSLGMEVDYMKRVNGFIDVDYIYLSQNEERR